MVDMESLSDKLKSLGMVPAKRVQAPENKPQHPSLESLIPGNEFNNGLGSFYLSQFDYPLGYQHGVVTFSELISTQEITVVTPNIDHSKINPSGLFFLDTETTGLAGGTGTLAFLVGLGYQTETGFRVDQYLIRDPGEEPSMLLELANFSEKSTVISTFNGKAFDIPLLNSRYTINKLPRPFDHLNHLDLLHLARRIWKNRLASRSLQDLEREILNIPRDENEVPSWMIPEIYFDYQRTGDPTQLAGVLYHNRMDILSLAALMIYISEAMRQISLEQYSLNLTDLYSLGVIYDDVGMHQEAEKLFAACVAAPKMEAAFLPEIYLRLGQIYKRRGQWADAVRMWELAAASPRIEPAIELAKFYEHQETDYRKALSWTQSAVKTVDNSLMLRYKKKRILDELGIRSKRLELLIQRQGNRE